MQLRITTFNVENLFNRYTFLDMPFEDRDFEKFVEATGVVSIASRKGDLVSYPITEIQRNNTAQAILDTQPDILALQEVENLYTLRIFNNTYLDNHFEHMILIDGNDLRGIDVGLLVRRGAPVFIEQIRTHIDDPIEPSKPVTRQSIANFGYSVKNAIFSRDCLEVDLKVSGKTLTMMINHFKAQDGKPASKVHRTKQAERVSALVDAATLAGKFPIVLGDLNVDPKTDQSLQPVLNNAHLRDPFPANTWTHYYVPDKKTSRLDYILPHKDLNVTHTEINRKGLTTKATVYDGPRYPTIGAEHTEASDHCPTAVTIEL